MGVYTVTGFFYHESVVYEEKSCANIMSEAISEYTSRIS